MELLKGAGIEIGTKDTLFNLTRKIEETLERQEIFMVIDTNDILYDEEIRYAFDDDSIISFYFDIVSEPEREEEKKNTIIKITKIEIKNR